MIKLSSESEPSPLEEQDGLEDLGARVDNVAKRIHNAKFTGRGDEEMVTQKYKDYCASVSEVLARAVAFVEEVGGVPVLLSMMVLMIQHHQPADALPTTVLELYEAALRASTSRVSSHFGRLMTLPMLTAIASANMSVKTREFTGAQANEALAHDAALQLWWKQVSKEDQPAIKILENDTVLDSKLGGLYQYRHLSFQEALAARALVSSAASAPASDEKVKELLREPFQHNMLRIGGGTLGAVLLHGLSALDLSETMLGDSGGQAVAALLAENRILERLNLESTALGAKAGMAIAKVVLRVNPSLTKIELRNNNFGDEGWGAIFKGICSNKNSKIVAMDASSERIGPAGATLIAEALQASVSSSLTSVSLLANKFDDATVAILLKLKEEKPALITLCGLKPDQTEANFAMQGLTPQDAKLLAPEILVISSLTKIS